MAIRDRDPIKTSLRTLINTNTTGAVSAADVRSVFSDVIDSSILGSERTGIIYSLTLADNVLSFIEGGVNKTITIPVSDAETYDDTGVVKNLTSLDNGFTYNIVGQDDTQTITFPRYDDSNVVKGLVSVSGGFSYMLGGQVKTINFPTPTPPFDASGLIRNISSIENGFTYEVIGSTGVKTINFPESTTGGMTTVENPYDDSQVVKNLKKQGNTLVFEINNVSMTIELPTGGTDGGGGTPFDITPYFSEKVVNGYDMNGNFAISFISIGNQNDIEAITNAFIGRGPSLTIVGGADGILLIRAEESQFTDGVNKFVAIVNQSWVAGSDRDIETRIPLSQFVRIGNSNFYKYSQTGSSDTANVVRFLNGQRFIVVDEVVRSDVISLNADIVTTTDNLRGIIDYTRISNTPSIPIGFDSSGQKLNVLHKAEILKEIETESVPEGISFFYDTETESVNTLTADKSRYLIGIPASISAVKQVHVLVGDTINDIDDLDLVRQRNVGDVAVFYYVLDGLQNNSIITATTTTKGSKLLLQDEIDNLTVRVDNNAITPQALQEFLRGSSIVNLDDPDWHVLIGSGIALDSSLDATLREFTTSSGGNSNKIPDTVSNVTVDNNGAQVSRAIGITGFHGDLTNILMGVNLRNISNSFTNASILSMKPLVAHDDTTALSFLEFIRFRNGEFEVLEQTSVGTDRTINVEEFIATHSGARTVSFTRSTAEREAGTPEEFEQSLLIDGPGVYTFYTTYIGNGNRLTTETQTITITDVDQDVAVVTRDYVGSAEHLTGRFGPTGDVLVARYGYGYDAETKSILVQGSIPATIAGIVLESRASHIVERRQQHNATYGYIGIGLPLQTDGFNSLLINIRPSASNTLEVLLSMRNPDGTITTAEIADTKIGIFDIDFREYQVSGSDMWVNDIDAVQFLNSIDIRNLVGSHYLETIQRYHRNDNYAMGFVRDANESDGIIIPTPLDITRFYQVTPDLRFNETIDESGVTTITNADTGEIINQYGTGGSGGTGGAIESRLVGTGTTTASGALNSGEKLIQVEIESAVITGSHWSSQIHLDNIPTTSGSKMLVLIDSNQPATTQVDKVVAVEIWNDNGTIRVNTPTGYLASRVLTIFALTGGSGSSEGGSGEIPNNLSVSTLTASQHVTSGEFRLTDGTNIYTELKGQVQSNDTDIGILQNSDRGHDTAITTVEGRATALETNDRALTGRVGVNEGNITALTGRTSDSETLIDANTTDIATNTSAITTLQNADVTFGGRLDTAETNISTLRTDVDAIDTSGGGGSEGPQTDFVVVARSDGASNIDFFVETEGDVSQTNQYYIVSSVTGDLTGALVGHENDLVRKKADGTLEFTTPPNNLFAFVLSDLGLDLSFLAGSFVKILNFVGGSWGEIQSSFVQGRNNTITGGESNAFGSGNTISGGQSVTVGRDNLVSESSSFTSGIALTNKAQVSALIGHNGVLAESGTRLMIATGSAIPTDAEKAGSVNVGSIFEVGFRGDVEAKGDVKAKSFIQVADDGTETTLGSGGSAGFQGDARVIPETGTNQYVLNTNEKFVQVKARVAISNGGTVSFISVMIPVGLLPTTSGTAERYIISSNNPPAYQGDKLVGVDIWNNNGTLTVTIPTGYLPNTSGVGVGTIQVVGLR